MQPSENGLRASILVKFLISDECLSIHRHLPYGMSPCLRVLVVIEPKVAVVEGSAQLPRASSGLQDGGAGFPICSEAETTHHLRSTSYIEGPSHENVSHDFSFRKFTVCLALAKPQPSSA